MDHGVGTTVFVRLDEVVVNRAEYERLQEMAVKYATLAGEAETTHVEESEGGPAEPTGAPTEAPPATEAPPPDEAPSEEESA